MKTKTKIILVAVAFSAMATGFYLYKRHKRIEADKHPHTKMTKALHHINELSKELTEANNAKLEHVEPYVKPTDEEKEGIVDDSGIPNGFHNNSAEYGIDVTAVKWDLVDEMRANGQEIDWDNPNLYYYGDEYIEEGNEDQQDEEGTFTGPVMDGPSVTTIEHHYNVDPSSNSSSMVKGDKDNELYSRSNHILDREKATEAQQENGAGSKGTNMADGSWKPQKVGQEGIMKYNENANSEWSDYKAVRLESIPDDSGVYMTMEDLFYRKFIAHRPDDDNVVDSCLQAREDFFGETSPYLEEVSWAEVILFFAQLADHDLNRGIYYWTSIFLDNIDLSSSSESFSIDNTLVELSDGEYINLKADTQSLFGFAIDDKNVDELHSLFDEYDYFAEITSAEIEDEKEYINYEDDDIDWDDPDDGMGDDLGYFGTEDD